MPKAFDKSPKISYPPSCKELSEELSKDELVRRLKLLARAFQDMGQEEDNAYKQLALYLTTEFFLEHSNKDVRLLVACCIADIFRIFAPEAPYTEAEQLKEIFLFLTQQLRGLEDPENPSFKRYFYLLENLAWVKSFNICIEIEDNQEIFCQLFKLIFSIINEKHSNKVSNFMLDMMCPLISEADSVSQELLDIILVNIIEPCKSQNKHAYNLAKDMIRRTASAIEPYIQTFFNNALMLGKSSESEVSGRLYELIFELNSVAPNVLLAVLPQLEFKLKSSDASERKHVTRMLARMFSDPDSDLAVQNKPLWNCFIGRFNDIDVDVRRICVQSCQEFIVQHQELICQIADPLKQRQHDPDENVRMDVIQAVIGAAKREFGNITPELLESVQERILDKKFKIRKEAIMGLGLVYKKLMLKEDQTATEKETLSWIRNKILHAYYRASLDDRILVERLLNTSLVPYSLEPDERMRRLYILYGNVDENAVKALQEVFKTQHNVRNIMRSLLELHQKEAQDAQQQKVARAVQLSKQLPDSQKSLEYVKKFSKLLADDARIRNSMIKLVSPDCNCKKAEDYVKEVLKKMGNPIPGNYMYTNVKMLLERIAPVMIDSEAILALLKIVNDSINGLGEINDDVDNASEKGLQLLLNLALVYPGCFQSEEVFTQLISFVKNDDDIISDLTLQIFAQIGTCLEEQYPNIFTSLLPVLQKLVKIGTPKQAKHAIKCIDRLCRNKKQIFSQIFEHLNKNMDLDSPNFLTSLVGIGHIAQICPGEFATSVRGLVSKFIVKDLLMQDRVDYQATSESWCDDRLVSEETKAKVQALKMIVRWLLGGKSNANSSASSALRLLYTLVLHEGDLMETGKINKAEMARLRLQAGCSMLRLSQEPIYSELVTLEQFQTLALLLNDPCYQVRLQFAQKLHKGLLSLKLPLQYLSIFSLAANDPLKERRLQCKNFLIANINKRRELLKQHSAVLSKIVAVLPEYVLPFTIHLLAHDPDLMSYNDTETLKNIRECLWFIMEPLIKSENYSFSFYKKMLETIKQTKDAQLPDSDEANFKLYAVCDLALTLVLTKTGNFVLKDFPAEPVLPKKLFSDPDPSFSNTKVYLPPELALHAQKSKKSNIVGIPAAAASVPASKKVNGRDISMDVMEQVGASPDSSVVSSPESTPAAPKRGFKRAAPVSPSESESEPAPKETQSKAATSQSTTEKPTRGRGRPKAASKPDTASREILSDEDVEEATKKIPPSKTISKRNSSADKSKTTIQGKKTQGKITDFIKSKGSTNRKSSSSSPPSKNKSPSPTVNKNSTNNNKPSRKTSSSPSRSRSPSGKENARSRTSRSESANRGVSAPKIVDSPSTRTRGIKKRISPTTVDSPVKRSKSGDKPSRGVRNLDKSLDSGRESRSSPQKRSLDGGSSTRGANKRDGFPTKIPSPTFTSSTFSSSLPSSISSPPPPLHVLKSNISPQPPQRPNIKYVPPKFLYSGNKDQRKASGLVNGTSDGEEGTPDSRKSVSPSTTPRKRAAAAALTKAIKEQGDAQINVKRKTRATKKR